MTPTASVGVQTGFPSGVAVVRRAVCGPRSISLTGCLFLAPLTVVATLITESRISGSFAQAALMTVILTAFSVVWLILADRTLLRGRRDHPVPLLSVLVVYVTTGITRPIVAGIVSPLIDHQNTTFVAIRFYSSVLASCFCLGLAAVILDGLDRRNAALANLQREREKLGKLRDSFEPKLTREQAVVSATVRVRLGPELGVLMVMIKSALTTPTAERTLIVAEQIRATSMDIVRPLSHTLARRDVFAPITPAGSDGPLQLRFISATEWRQVVRDTFLIRPISPVVVPALFFISSSGFVMGRYGFVAGSVALAAEAVVMGAVLWGCRWYLSRARLTRMSQGARVAAFIGSYLAACLLGQGLTLPLWPPLAAGVTLSGFFVVFFIAFAVAFGEAIRANHQQTLDSLRAAVASERWEVKRQGRELRALSVTVGRRLHGDVQSQLSVLSLTLMALADSPEATDEDRRAALVNALSIVESLEVRVTDPQGSNEKSEFIEALTEIRDAWRGFIDVELHIADDVLKLVDLFEIGGTLIELVREAIQNASRHGASSQIRINVTATREEIHFCADDNGVGPRSGSDVGLGLRQLSEDGFEWDLQSSDVGGARLTVRIPVYAGDSLDGQQFADGVV